jgi:outer membrane protein assembly factor BamA
VRYGASLGAYYDLTGEQRNVSATAIVDFSDPLGSGEVPVTDLVTLGGDRPLRGFLANQFVDRSAAALRLEYRWPVAVWLDGSLLYEAGSVFGQGLSGFDLGAFRNSYGFGMAAVGAQDHPFQVLLALGTKPWESGGAIDSFRFVFGTTAGF